MQSRQRHLVFSVVVGTVLLLLGGSLLGCSSRASAKGTPASNDLVLPLAIGLKRNQSGLESRATDLSDPKSQSFRSWMSASQLADAFGASQNDAESVLKSLQAAGFTGAIDLTRGLIIGQMKVSDANNFFNTTIVQSGDAPKTVVQPSQPLKVPAALRSRVSEVVGLTARVSPPASTSSTMVPTSRDSTISCPASTDVTERAIEWYEATTLPPLNSTGHDVGIAMLQIDRSSQAAIDRFGSCHGLQMATVKTLRIDASTDTDFGTSAQESTLDVIAASTVAPDLASITMIQFNPFSSIAFPLAAAVDASLAPNGPQVIATSIGVCESTMTDAERSISEWSLLTAAASGATVIAAAGDNGSSACAPSITKEAVQYPASSPWVTAVGGSQWVRSTTGTGAVVDEVVWNATPTTKQAGGGAPSNVFARPSWQARLSGPKKRLVPDVSFLASPSTFGDIPVCDTSGACTDLQLGGTSIAAPGFAGAIADIIDALTSSGQPPIRLGPLNPVLYNLAATQPSIFHDITQGTNDLYNVGCCTAATGYDTASGLGSLRLGPLAAAVHR